MKDRKKEKINDKLNKQRYKCPNCGWESDENQLDDPWDHCPNCLGGIHTEEMEYGICGGILEPIGIWVKKDGEWMILQRCSLCGEMLAVSKSPYDNPIKVLSIASKPLSSPPFPIERTEELTRIMGGSGDTGGNRK